MSHLQQCGVDNTTSEQLTATFTQLSRSDILNPTTVSTCLVNALNL